jgi:2-polyprenyl-3-methyl-5-hydroxy-6-metoxy-1,4-benzoquinol methylase
MNRHSEDLDGVEHRLRQSWDANADAWTRTVREAGIPSRRAGTDAAIVQAVAEASPRRVLDVGCGEGWLARELASRGLDVIGIDASAELVRRASESGGGQFRVLAYEQIIENPAVLGAPFDAVVCNFSLLGERLAPLLRALATALAADGRMLIQTVHPFTACGDEPYRDAWREESFQGFGHSFSEPMPWFFHTMASWLRVLNDAKLFVADMREPVDPATGRPLSLLLTAQRACLGAGGAADEPRSASSGVG